MELNILNSQLVLQIAMILQESSLELFNISLLLSVQKIIAIDLFGSFSSSNKRL